MIAVLLWVLAGAAMLTALWFEVVRLPTVGGRNAVADRLYLAAVVLIVLSIFFPIGV